MIIIDENVDQPLVAKIKERTPDLISIREDYPGVSDQDVIMIAKLSSLPHPSRFHQFQDPVC
jgi:hypothetical protein